MIDLMVKPISPVDQNLRGLHPMRLTLAPSTTFTFETRFFTAQP